MALTEIFPFSAVDEAHAVFLQNELICALVPRDNRLQCDALFPDDDDDRRIPPDSYDHDLDMLIEAVEYRFDDSQGVEFDDDIPF